jgi:predicted RNA-binding protein
MCLSTIISTENNQRKEIARNVAAVRVDGNKITVTDIMGVKTVIDGEIDRIDLMENFIFLKNKTA